MSRNKPRPLRGFPPRHPEPLGTLLKHPRGVDALHEGSHGVLHAVMDTPGFESVDIKIRTHQTNPEIGEDFKSMGMTQVVWPNLMTKGCSWKRALGAVAPGVTSGLLKYRDDGFISDQRELSAIAEDLGIVPEELLRTAWRLTEDLIVNNAAVLAAIINTAVDLLNRKELAADEVRAALKRMLADPPGWPISLSAELQGLIGITDLIDRHDRTICQRAQSG